MNDTQHADAFYEVRVNHRPFSKYAVALQSISLLDEGCSLLIDAGSSLTPIAKIIRKLADIAAKSTHYTIMTHNNDAFNALSDVPPVARFNVFQTGGRYDRDLNASFGHQAEMAYLRFHPRWVFVGQNGLAADLGLFCHGNTEELALKREIFAMAAWGRVIISDFTKIGVPGGLLFGDSSNLTTNVEECRIITDDIHDQKFDREVVEWARRGDAHDRQGGPEEQERTRRDAIERFERQVRSLHETYGVTVDHVHYVVYRGRYPDPAPDGPPSLCRAEFLPKPHSIFAPAARDGKIAREDVFRIILTRSDLKDGEAEARLNGKGELRGNVAESYVDISFSVDGTPRRVSVLYVHDPRSCGPRGTGHRRGPGRRVKGLGAPRPGR